MWAGLCSFAIQNCDDADTAPLLLTELLRLLSLTCSHLETIKATLLAPDHSGFAATRWKALHATFLQPPSKGHGRHGSTLTQGVAAFLDGASSIANVVQSCALVFFGSPSKQIRLLALCVFHYIARVQELFGSFSEDAQGPTVHATTLRPSVANILEECGDVIVAEGNELVKEWCGVGCNWGDEGRSFRRIGTCFAPFTVLADEGRSQPQDWTISPIQVTVEGTTYTSVSDLQTIAASRTTSWRRFCQVHLNTVFPWVTTMLLSQRLVVHSAER